MNRRIALIAVAVALVGVAGVAAVGPVGTAVAQDDPVATNQTDAGNEAVNGSDLSPGERFSGVIGVQQAEVSGEVDSRAFEVGLNRTETPEQRAALVSERLNRTEDRLTEIERRQRELRERRDAGELSQGAFAARMAETSARAQTAKREANRSAAVAADLPEPVRADRGLTEDRLDGLRQRAGNATGPEVAAIARGVAGNDVGGPLASDRRGPPASAGDGPERGGGPRTGNGSEGGAGAGADDGPRAGGGPRAGDDSSAPRNGTDGNATDGSDDAANAVGTPGQAGDDTTDRGADAADGRSGESATPSGAGPSSPGGEERGNRSSAGANGMHAIDSVADRLVRPLADGAGLVRGIIGSVTA